MHLDGVTCQVISQGPPQCWPPTDGQHSIRLGACFWENAEGYGESWSRCLALPRAAPWNTHPFWILVAYSSPRRRG